MRPPSAPSKALSSAHNPEQAQAATPPASPWLSGQHRQVPPSQHPPLASQQLARGLGAGPSRGTPVPVPHGKAAQGSAGMLSGMGKEWGRRGWWGMYVLRMRN